LPPAIRGQPRHDVFSRRGIGYDADVAFKAGRAIFCRRLNCATGSIRLAGGTRCVESGGKVFGNGNLPCRKPSLSEALKHQAGTASESCHQTPSHQHPEARLTPAEL